MASPQTSPPQGGTPGVTPSPVPGGPAPHTFVTGINSPPAKVAPSTAAAAAVLGGSVIPASVGTTFASYTFTLGRVVPFNVNRARRATLRIPRAVK